MLHATAQYISILNEGDGLDKRAFLAVAAIALLFAFSAGPRAATKPIALQNSFIQDIADQYLRQIPEVADRSGFRRVEAVYRRLIETTAFGEPVGLDVWRWRGPPDDAQPPYIENRAISPLLFGIGSCEDYAAAMAVLLRRMGYPADYLPGLTVSVEGKLVEHAWTVAQVEGNWYHLDAQLEDNVTRGNQLTYRFFMKTDREMSADHRWGESWLRYGMSEAVPLTERQRCAIARDYTPPPCRTASVPPAVRTLTPDVRPSRAGLLKTLRAERDTWEQEHGPLAPFALDVAAPLFGTQPQNWR